MVSPTGIAYAPGTPPVATSRSQTATLYLRQDRLDRALDLLIEGMGEDPGNPIHFYLAGVVYARLGDYRDAHAMFTEAQRIYPAYELQTELEREAAWGQAFNEGLEAYSSGDVESAIDVWSAATLLFDLRPEAHRNLASLLSSELRYAEAISVFRSALEGLAKRPATREIGPEEALIRAEASAEIEASLTELLVATERFAEAEPLLRQQLAREPGSVQVRADLAAALSGQGRVAEADAMYATILSRTDLDAEQLYNVGVALFRSTNFAQAAEAFRQMTELTPRSRDAWFNYANALFAAEDWPALAAAGGRLVELDPLGETSRLITARAQLEAGDRDGALRTLDAIDQAPIYVDGLQLQRAGGITTIVGRVSGNAAEPDSPVHLRFSFYDDSGSLLGHTTLMVPAPSPDDTHELELEFALPAAGYWYELIS
ncbi:MAG: tetratricopeptide repeat protein [Gemmatimonadota bacterium]|nr:tetratricopeptide repeat protein [Gemmatimonadota bacterium]MDH3421464.1 tetratricopeptide repeat protein [Gemmatimonadota bacterium]